MSSALCCLALAVVLLPAPGGRRRFARLLGPERKSRKVPLRLVFRVLAGACVAGSAAVGVGPLIATVMVFGTVFVRTRQTRGDRRRAGDRAALAEGLETVVGELRAGAPPSTAAAAAASDLRGPVGRAFAVCSARSRLGGSAAEGLRDPGAVIADELSRTADAWQVAEQHGLSLADLVAAARSDLLSRIRFRDRTAAALAGARATATVLAGLPLFGIALGQLLGAAPLRVLLAPGLGTVLLPLGTALLCAGLLWTDAITRRVLT